MGQLHWYRSGLFPLSSLFMCVWIFVCDDFAYLCTWYGELKDTPLEWWILPETFGRRIRLQFFLEILQMNISRGLLAPKTNMSFQSKVLWEKKTWHIPSPDSKCSKATFLERQGIPWSVFLKCPASISYLLMSVSSMGKRSKWACVHRPLWRSPWLGPGIDKALNSSSGWGIQEKGSVSCRKWSQFVPPSFPA